jgi:hypothetical protein
MGCCCTKDDGSELQSSLLLHQGQPDFDESSLAVTVKLRGGKGLPNSGMGNDCDPYVYFALTSNPEDRRKSSGTANR